MANDVASQARLFREVDNLDGRAVAGVLRESRELPGRFLAYGQVFFPQIVEGNGGSPDRICAATGPRPLQAAAVAGVLMDSTPSGPAAPQRAFWSDSLRRGAAAYLLAQACGDIPKHQAFIGGVGSTWGMCQLLTDPERWLAWAREVRRVPMLERTERERLLFRGDHVRAMVAFAKQNSLPERMIQMVELQTQRGAAHGDSLARLLDAVFVGNELADALASTQAEDALEEWVVTCSTTLGLEPAEAWDLADATLEATGKLAKAWGIPIESQPTVAQITSGTGISFEPEQMTREELENWARSMADEVDMLRKENQDLQRQLAAARGQDPVTGLATHESFVRELKRAVGASDAAHKDPAVLVADIDSFHEVNKSCGYLTGEAVLKKVAESLAGVWRQSAVVARIGPDAFATIVYGGEREARLAAERARAAVGEIRLNSQDLRPVRVTISVAGALASSLEPAADPSELLGRVEGLLYASRGSGGNRTWW